MSLTNKFRVVSIPDGAASNMTAYQVVPFTATDLLNQGTKEHSAAALMVGAEEARVVGVTQKSLYELLMGRVKEVDKGVLQEKKISNGRSLVLPYTFRRRKNQFSDDTFVVTAGVADARAGTTVSGIAYPTSSWKITVGLGPSWMAAPNGIPALERYFLKGEYIYLEWVDKTGTIGTTLHKRTTPFKVVNSENINATTCFVTLEPCVSAAAWAAYTAGQKAAFQPDHGVISMGTNNVEDHEAWAFNQPANDTSSLIVDWFQSSRYAQTYTKEYAELMQAYLDGDVNALQESFFNLPQVEVNKQQYARYQRKWINTVFYGNVINEFQTPETVTQLPTAVDPDGSGDIFAYKANVLGLYTLLQNEGQVVDLKGADLDLGMLWDRSYKLKKNREANGDACPIVCYMTDKDTAKRIDKAMIDAIKNYYGGQVTLPVEKGEMISQEGIASGRYTYRKYDVPGHNFQLAIFAEDFFTENLTNYGDGSGGVNGTVNFRTAGRKLVGVDWSDFSIGVIATASAKREYKGETFANTHPLYSQAIALNTKYIDLRSTTYTTRLGDAACSLIIENFGNVAAYTVS